MSPDGRFVAVYGTEAGDFSIWVHDIERSVKRQLTFSTGGFRPIWSSDGKQILFARNNKIYRISAVASGEREALFSDQGYPCEYSRDGSYFVYQQGTDLWYRKDGAEPAAFTQKQFVDRVAKLSPDGRFLAYCSLRSGRDDVYVQRFPDGGPEWLISPNGGTQPRWSGNGKELFYVAHGTLFSVPVTLSPSFSWDSPRPLFSNPGLVDSTPEQQYDVTEDGQRFIVVDTLKPGSGERPSIRIVQNWVSEFRNFQPE